MDMVRSCDSNCIDEWNHVDRIDAPGINRKKRIVAIVLAIRSKWYTIYGVSYGFILDLLLSRTGVYPHFIAIKIINHHIFWGFPWVFSKHNNIRNTYEYNQEIVNTTVSVIYWQYAISSKTIGYPGLNVYKNKNIEKTYENIWKTHILPTVAAKSCTSW